MTFDTNGGEEKTVALSEIIASDSLQIRPCGLDSGRVKMLTDLLRSGGTFKDPIVLARLKGEGSTLYLIDGFHRFTAAQRYGRGYLQALIIPGEITREEAKWQAAKANLTHGLPLTSRRDRAAAFDAYVRAGQHLHEARRRAGTGRPKSFREISAELGGEPTFSACRKRMMREHPSIYARHYERGRESEEAGEDRYDHQAFAEKARKRDLEIAFEAIAKTYRATPTEEGRAAIRRQLAALARSPLKPLKQDQDDEF